MAKSGQLSDFEPGPNRVPNNRIVDAPRGKSFRGQRFPNTTNFSNMNLASADFRDTKFAGAKDHWKPLSSLVHRVSFSSANLMGSDFTNAKLGDGVNMTDTNLRDANFSFAVGGRIDFNGANLRGAQFVNSRIDGYYHNADLTDVNFQNATVTGRFWGRTSLHGATFQDASLDASFGEVDLSDANFTGANFFGSRFSKTNLLGAKITVAQIANASEFIDCLVDDDKKEVAATRTLDYYNLKEKKPGIWYFLKSYGPKYDSNKYKKVWRNDAVNRALVDVKGRLPTLEEMSDNPPGRLVTMWYENGQKASNGKINNGELVSASVWKPDGEPCPITKIVDGSGVFVQYHENGQKYHEEHWQNGKKDGLFVEWDKNGNKTKEIQYQNGKEISRKEF